MLLPLTLLILFNVGDPGGRGHIGGVFAMVLFLMRSIVRSLARCLRSLTSSVLGSLVNFALKKVCFE